MKFDQEDWEAKTCCRPGRVRTACRPAATVNDYNPLTPRPAWRPSPRSRPAPYGDGGSSDWPAEHDTPADAEFYIKVRIDDPQDQFSGSGHVRGFAPAGCLRLMRHPRGRLRRQAPGAVGELQTGAMPTSLAAADLTSAAPSRYARSNSSGPPPASRPPWLPRARGCTRPGPPWSGPRAGDLHDEHGLQRCSSAGTVTAKTGENSSRPGCGRHPKLGGRQR